MVALFVLRVTRYATPTKQINYATTNISGMIREIKLKPIIFILSNNGALILMQQLIKIMCDKTNSSSQNVSH